MDKHFKIFFDNKNGITLTPNTEYEFIHKHGLDKFKMEFKGYSRIDNEPLFTIDGGTQHKGYMSDYTLLCMDILNVILITPLEDQTKYIKEMSIIEKRVNEILSELSINKRDLVKDDIYESIIRDIKLMKINI